MQSTLYNTLMIWWNVKALAEALRENKVPKAQSDLYLMIFIAELLVPMVLYSWGVVVVNRASALLVLLLTALGVTLGRLAVQRGDGKDYFARFSTLAVPVLARLYFLAAATYFLIWWATPRLLTCFWFPVLFWCLLTLFIFRSINSYLRWIAEIKPSFTARQGI